MKQKSPHRFQTTDRLALAAAVLWVVVLAASFAWNRHQINHSMMVLAQNEARASFEKDLVYRRWAAAHGGVYVPPTEASPPNPYLAHLPDRDVTTTSGNQLTLINPAYMTRQVYELGREQYGLQGRITSLNPIRRKNAPDAWEAEALRSFKEGAQQATDLEIMNGKPYLRFMRPITTEKNCLKCHADQGYSVGEIHGGISLSVPLAAYLSQSEKQLSAMALVYVLIGTLGLVGLWVGNRLLRRERDLNEYYLDSIRNCVMALDPTGRVTMINRAGCELLGHAEEEILGRHWFSTFLPQPHGMTDVYPVFQRMMAGEPSSADYFENSVVCRDGTVRLMGWHNTCLKNHDGKILGILSSGEDITARKQIEEQLRKLSRAVEQSPVSIVLTDLDGTIEYVNPAFTRVTGYSFEEAIGENPRILKSSDKNKEEYRELWETISSGREWRGEFKNIKKNGEVFWESASISPIVNDQDHPTHYIAVKEDITERKKAEAALLEARREAEAATQAKSQFLANMSHEIRTPMNGVIGMIELLLDTRLTKEQRRYAEMAQSSGKALLNLVNDILDFSKIEAGRMELEMLDFDLQSLMDDFTATMALSAYEKGLEFLSIMNHDVPPLLRGDPGRLRQILTNLVGNAVKFTEHGEIVVGTSVEQTEDQQVLLRFSIRDTGIGIPEDKTNLLFDKFSQVDASITRKFGGSGLGLAISKQLAEMMGGKVGVTSTPGQGSEFWFTARFTRQKIERPSVVETHKDLRGLHVLVVDNHVGIRTFLAKELTSWGMRPEVADSGEAVLQVLAAAQDKGDPFELAIVDTQIPCMNDGELSRQIKSDPRFQAIPLVMVTSLGRPGDARRYAELGFAAYLNKPIRRSELFDTLVLVMAHMGQRSPTKPIITRHLVRETLHRPKPLPRLSGHILVAEDNPVNRQVALNMLNKLGLSADIVANGREALNALEATHYDLVLMDVMMPEMDGLEATRLIRKREAERMKGEGEKAISPDPSPLASRLSPLPIIAMTAGALQQDRERCIEAGMDDYTAKPVKPDELALVLDKWLQKNASPESKDRNGGLGGGRLDTKSKEPEHLPAHELPLQEFQYTGISQVPSAPIVFNRKALLNRVMDDEELIQEIVEIFLENTPGRIEDLRAAVNAGDAPTARLLAHTIKGMAANLSGEALQALAQEIEDAAGSEDLNAIRDLTAELERRFDQLRKTLQEELRGF